METSEETSSSTTWWKKAGGILRQGLVCATMIVIMSTHFQRWNAPQEEVFVTETHHQREELSCTWCMEAVYAFGRDAYEILVKGPLQIAQRWVYDIPVALVRATIHTGRLKQPRCIAFMYSLPLMYSNGTDIDKPYMDTVCGFKEDQATCGVPTDMAFTHALLLFFPLVGMMLWYSVDGEWFLQNPFFWVMQVMSTLLIGYSYWLFQILADYDRLHGTLPVS